MIFSTVERISFGKLYAKRKLALFTRLSSSEIDLFFYDFAHAKEEKHLWIKWLSLLREEFLT